MKYKTEANFTASTSLNKTYIMANETIVFKKYLKNNPKNNWNLSVSGIGKF
jgi:hypothetical protein